MIITLVGPWENLFSNSGILEVYTFWLVVLYIIFNKENV